MQRKFIMAVLLIVFLALAINSGTDTAGLGSAIESSMSSAKEATKMSKESALDWRSNSTSKGKSIVVNLVKDPTESAQTGNALNMDQKTINAPDELTDESLPEDVTLTSKMEEITEDLTRDIIRAQAGEDVNIEETVINAIDGLIDESLPGGMTLTPAMKGIIGDLTRNIVKGAQAGRDVNIEDQVINSLDRLIDESLPEGMTLTPKMKKITKDLMKGTQTGEDVEKFLSVLGELIDEPVE